MMDGEEVIGVLGENPHSHRGNMQTPLIKAQGLGIEPTTLRQRERQPPLHRDSTLLI